MTCPIMKNGKCLKEKCKLYSHKDNFEKCELEFIRETAIKFYDLGRLFDDLEQITSIFK